MNEFIGIKENQMYYPSVSFTTAVEKEKKRRKNVDTKSVNRSTWLTETMEGTSGLNSHRQLAQINGFVRLSGIPIWNHFICLVTKTAILKTSWLLLFIYSICSQFHINMVAF